MKRIGVMTSGGDAPGMNACIRAVVRTGLFHGLQVIGIEEGFDGLLRGDMNELSARDVGGILQRGGTFLKTARCPEFLEEKRRLHGLRELNERNITGVVVIGGDGSMKGAHELAKMGMAVMGVPASIDNDVWGTEMSLGVDTAINTIMDAVDKLRDTASSHQRVFLIETMGRKCGYLALMAGIICGAELILIPEREISLEEIAKTVIDAYARGKAHAIIIIAEGAALKMQDVAEYLDTQQVGFTTRVTTLGHVQRGGSPSAFDRMLATRMGVRAVEMLLQGESDKLLALEKAEIITVPLEKVVPRTKQVNVDYFEMAHMLAR
jgi:6-phosphofructokinase 1